MKTIRIAVVFPDLEPKLPGYEVGMLTTRPRCSVTYIHLLISFAHSLTRSRNVSDGRTAAVAARDVSADRTARQYWWLPERSGRQIGS
jgi:hypothetical protein